MKLIVHIFVILLAIESISAIRCYICSMGEDDTTTECIDHPEQAATVLNCDKKYCTIVRAEYKDPKDKVKSFSRSCSDASRNEIAEDETNRYYFVSCNSALCNGGSGKGGGSSSKKSLGDKSTIYCPGLGNSVTSISAMSLITLLSVHTFFKILI